MQGGDKKPFWLNKAHNERKRAHQERICPKKMKMAKCLWNAHRWCFSCGQQSLKALWLEFRQITSYHYNLSISWEMAVHLRNKCFPKSSSYCVFACTTNRFILHASPPPRDGFFVIYFSWWLKKKLHFTLFIFFHLSFFLWGRYFSFFPLFVHRSMGF